jgi:hypothetical protein
MIPTPHRDPDRISLAFLREFALRHGLLIEVDPELNREVITFGDRVFYADALPAGGGL